MSVPRRFRRGPRAASGWMAAALAAVFGVLAGSDVRAQSKRVRPPPDYVQLAPPDQAEGRTILESFRRSDQGGDCHLEFVLRVMPRRGEERRVAGRLWQRAGADGVARRVELRAGETADSPVLLRLLLRGGADSGLWGWRPGAAAAERLAGPAMFGSLAGTEITPFDLQMPFLEWRESAYEGLKKVRGRPTHAFLLYPPDDVVRARPDLVAVRIFIDAQFQALVQVEHLGEGARALRSVHVNDLKRLGERWMVKSLDVRDDATRNKTRLLMVGAALDAEFAEALFTPEELSSAILPPELTPIPP
jgi:hypothetical protein